jgi:CheY-like chemotaxis protein
MPGMDGFEVLNRLRADKRAVNLPVLVITGQDLRPEDKAYIKRRMAALVRKREASLEHIAEAVEQILGVRLEQ